MSQIRMKLLIPLVVLLLASTSGYADPVPLSNLSEPLLRERVRLYLLTNEGKLQVVPVRLLARLQVEQIFYTASGGKPVRLAWQYEPIGMLTASQSQTVEKVLREVFTQVFGNFQGGLLSDADKDLVFEVMVVRPTPPISNRPPEGSSPPLPTGGRGATLGGNAAAVPVPRLGIAWYYGCGSCCPELIPFYFYYYTYESTSSHTAVCRSSAASTLAVTTSTRRPDIETNEIRQIMLERLKDAKDPSALYWRARTYYWQGDKGAALALLIRATELDAQDARYWYFRALAERAVGENEAAKESARRAAALKMLRHPDELQIGLALERVQGAERKYLRDAAGEILTSDTAMQIARVPIPRRLPSTGVFPSIPSSEDLAVTRRTGERHPEQ